MLARKLVRRAYQECKGLYYNKLLRETHNLRKPQTLIPEVQTPLFPSVVANDPLQVLSHATHHVLGTMELYTFPHIHHAEIWPDPPLEEGGPGRHSPPAPQV